MLKIRNASNLDVKEILDLHYAGLLETGSLSDDKSLDQDLFNIDAFYDGVNNRLLVATNHDNKIVGMGAIKKISDTLCEIKRMRVDQNSRRQGVAQKILDELISYANCRLGAEVIMLDTSEKQSAAQRFYEKNGFSRSSRKIIGGIPSLIYVKSLINNDMESRHDAGKK